MFDMPDVEDKSSEDSPTKSTAHGMGDDLSILQVPPHSTCDLDNNIIITL